MDEWQERQLAAEFAIMQLAKLVQGLCQAAGGKEIWDAAVEIWKPTAPAANIVPLFGSVSPDHERRVRALMAGLLQGQHPHVTLDALRTDGR